jgi:PEP-CTERM motif
MKIILGLIAVLATVSVAKAQSVNPQIAVPEPATITLLVLGTAALGVARFRRKP